MKNADMPAMPVVDESGPFITEGVPSIGLSKREHFAGLAMQACRSRSSGYNSWDDLAKDSVEIADALLAELEKPSK